MHELSLAQALLHQLHDLASQNKASRIVTVTVEIGPHAGIVIDSFEFGFTILAAESPITQLAELKINTPDAIYQCLDCGQEDQSSQVCSACRGDMMMPMGGSDITLMQVEMDTADQDG